MQELLAQDRNDYLQQVAPSYVNKSQSPVNLPEFCSPNTVRGQLIKRNFSNFPNDVSGPKQQPALANHSQNSSEPVRLLGVDIYSFPGSIIQCNDTPSRFQQQGQFDVSLSESQSEKSYENGDNSCLQKTDDNSVALMSTALSSSSTHHIAVSSASHSDPSGVMRPYSPSSHKKADVANFDPIQAYDSMNQDMKSVEDWTAVTACSVDGKSTSVRPDSMVRSTVEQLLCAPDPTSSSVTQFFHDSSDAGLVASEEFRSISGISPVNDFTGSMQRSSFSNAKGNETTPVQFDSPLNQPDQADILSELAYQKHVNSETDAFFTDLQEILARDMPSLDNSTPKTAEWINGISSSVGLKEECSRWGDTGHSRSPFTGTKPICTASLMSGDSGLESWSSSSSCSAGPNSSSVWGPLEGICNTKSSPDAHTPQPASVTIHGQLDSDALLSYDGLSDGLIFDEPSTSAAVTLGDRNRILLNSNRAPSRTPENNNGGPSVSFATNIVHSGMGDRPLVSPVTSQIHSNGRSKYLIDEASDLIVQSAF